MRRHCHYSSCAVASKHIVAHIDGYLFSGKRVACVGTGEYPAHLLFYLAFALRLMLHLVEICFHGTPLLLADKKRNVFRFRSKHHERHAEDGICPRSENLQFKVLAHHRETHLRPLAAPDPVALRLLERFRPFELFEVIKKTRGVC